MSVSFGHDKAFEDEMPAECFLNISNMNAVAFFTLLGVDSHNDDGFCGSMTLPEARRAIMRARNMNPVRVLREASVTYGAPRANEDGTVELRPIRVMEMALTIGQIEHYITALECIVVHATAQGASKIWWS